MESVTDVFFSFVGLKNNMMFCRFCHRVSLGVLCPAQGGAWHPKNAVRSKKIAGSIGSWEAGDPQAGYMSNRASEEVLSHGSIPMAGCFFFFKGK